MTETKIKQELLLIEAWIKLHKKEFYLCQSFTNHYNDIIMSMMASQITSLTIVYSTVYPDADQRKL